jgi:hypothetical protein
MSSFQQPQEGQQTSMDISSASASPQTIWSSLSHDLIVQCLLYLDPLLLAKLSWFAKVYNGAFRQSIEKAWRELTDWEDSAEMTFPPSVKSFLAAWNELHLIYQKCITIGRNGRPDCQFLRNIRLPSRNEYLSDMSHSGFICVSKVEVDRVHKELNVFFASFIDLHGKFGPPGCIVELEIVSTIYDDEYLDIEQDLFERQERTQFYIEMGYHAHGFGVSAPDFFSWKRMFPSNQFFHDRPVSKYNKQPLIWEYNGWKSWMADLSSHTQMQDEDEEEVEEKEEDDDDSLVVCYKEWVPSAAQDDAPNQHASELLTKPIDLNDSWPLSHQASCCIGHQWNRLKPYIHKRYMRKVFRQILIQSTRFYECLLKHRDNQESRERIYRGYADCLKLSHNHVRDNFALPHIQQTWFEVLAQYCEEIRQREVEDKQNLLWDVDDFRAFLLYPLYHHEILNQ